MTRGNGTRLHVTLLRPPILKMPKSLSSFGVILPIGIAYVAAVLREAGHRVTIVDAPGEALDRFVKWPSPVGELEMNGLTPVEVVERIPEDTDVIGITHMFLHEWPVVREIAERARVCFPDARIVLGGENATAFRDEIFRETAAVDHCVLGEGEVTMRELCERLASGADVRDVPGLAYRGDHGACETNGLSPRTIAVDDLPRPAWDLLPVDRYMEVTDTFGVHRGRSMPMLATRGCPYQCTFCSSPDMWTTRYVTRRPEDVVAEMVDYQRRWQIDNFDFCDLTAFVKRDWALEFCQRLSEAKLDVTWQLPSGTRSEVLDHDVLSLAYRTGCRNITYAPESGSVRMLKQIKKKVKPDRLLASLRTAHEIGIVTRINLIIGHPSERLADQIESLKFLVRTALTGCFDASVMVFAPYPGSADFDDLMRAGKIELNDGYYYTALVRSGLSSQTYHPTMSTRRLFVTQYLFLLTFYAMAYLGRPWRLAGLLRAFLTGHEETNLDTLLRVKIKQRLQRLRPRPLAAAGVPNAGRELA